MMDYTKSKSEINMIKGANSHAITGGAHINPGNESFRVIRNGIYVDKTGLIDLINNTIDTKDKLTCISRPRRFGKSYTAQMLCAYYDKGCDSGELFSDLEIANKASFRRYLNAFNVIYLDITSFISAADSVDNIVNDIKNTLRRELQAEFSVSGEESTISELLLNICSVLGSKFFFVIDEWDALFREFKDNVAIQEQYINLLREIFKNSGVTDRIVAGAFMTGILPIKKYGHQSAISDFREYSMIQPSLFAEYVGFTKKDIASLEKNYTINKSALQKWYDGYRFPSVGEVYNPNSVCQAIRTQTYDTYWSKTETYEALLEYINLDSNGLQADIIQMLGGNEMPVDTATFQNDMTSVQSRDDVLSLLIHLGYLAYDSSSCKTRIPNEEIRREFISSVRSESHKVTNKIIRNSDQLIVDTIEGNQEAVARAIEEAHDAGTFGISPLFYNDEQALRSVVKFAYISCLNDYLKIEELPAGKGYADVVYLPKKHSSLPALLIELKSGQSAEGAIIQIHNRNYPKVLENSGYEVILCGINYDPKTKKHSCIIEKMKME